MGIETGPGTEPSVEMLEARLREVEAKFAETVAAFKAEIGSIIDREARDIVADNPGTGRGSRNQLELTATDGFNVLVQLGGQVSEARKDLERARPRTE